MADTILCNNGSEGCNCNCNCHACFLNNFLLSAESLIVDGNIYTFQYLITNAYQTLNNLIFCIQCPTSSFEITLNDIEITIIGNPNQSAVQYTECTSTPCPDNSYVLSLLSSEDSNCCKNQGLNIDINSAASINEVRLIISFTAPAGIVMSFQPGAFRIKSGEEYSIVNYVCMPGCEVECNRGNNICKMWIAEKNIIVAKKDVFIHYAQQLFPEELDISTLTLSDLENKIRLLVKLEKSTAKLNCNIAKVLEELKNDCSKNKCCQ